MSKIGILTFNRAINYGAVLQAYALKSIIAKKTSCEIVNYETIYGKKAYHVSSKKDFLKNIIKKILVGKKHKLFNKFINENATETIYDNQSRESILENGFDKIIVGSDQVWNYTCSGEYPTFLLDFANGIDNIGCYSYAASFGVSSLPKEHIDCYKQNIKKFKKISTREETGCRILKEQLDIDSIVTLDPTLLLDKEEWNQCLSLNGAKKKYILTYFLDSDKKLERISKAISKQTGLPIYNIATSPKSFFGNKVIKNAGPKEWVEYFYNAEFIVTSSFHGTAFAINFGKQFYTYAKNDRASRIVDILKTLGIENRRISDANEVDLNQKINYDEVNIKLNEEKKKSYEFIESIIND